ncbi:F0F1 ATP synthase subunit A [Owenweeksia hongkongensis]|nr:F0F1 ATP synthase subunit A [Owenweeksia hongkongensis]
MSKYLKLSSLAVFMLLLGFSSNLQAQDKNEHNLEDRAAEKVDLDHSQLDEHHEEAAHGDEEGEFDPAEMILHHIGDTHGFHVYGEGHDAVSVALPVILWTDNGLVTFMSSAFHHDIEGREVVERNGMRFVNLHEHIFMLEEGATTLELDDEHHPVNASAPVDLSITKNVFTLLMSAVFLCLIFIPVGGKYKKGHAVPSGLASFMEPLVVFVRDEIARPNIGKKYEKYMGFLLTIFFLIWINNLIGLIPFFPFSANLSGNIAFTMTLAAFTLIVVNINGSKHYWSHIFAPPTHWALWPIMIPIEVIGILTKPFALMIRLFANISAGHIIILSLMSLIFVFKNVGVAGISVPFALFISVLELLVAALQAFIFTMLAALFIGQAVEEGH